MSCYQTLFKITQEKNNLYVAIIWLHYFDADYLRQHLLVCLSSDINQ